MSATEQMRAMLDGLMGTARDGSDSQRQRLHFTDSRVCRAFLLDCCPHDIFASTKLELGDCSKTHDPGLRADYINAIKNNKSDDYFYEINALERLQSFVNEADKKTEYLKRKLAETQEELTAEETSKLNNVHELTEKLGKKLAQVEKADADDDLEAKQKFLDEAEKIKKERANAEQEYKKVSRPVSSHQQQNLRVCDICSAYLGINDNDSRLADHFGGKLHLGFITVREKLEDLRKIVSERRGLSKRGGGGLHKEVSSGRDRNHDKERGRNHDYDRNLRDRDYHRDQEYRRGREYDSYRDYDRDRYRDRERNRSRDTRHYDREPVRDRSRSNGRYYRESSNRDSRPRDNRYRDDRLDRADRPSRADTQERSNRDDSLFSSKSTRTPQSNHDSATQERDLSYQRRLREWEKREAAKAKKYAIRLSEEQERKQLEEHESKKLKEFLEDYKDDRDDVRFYCGTALSRRMADRRKEMAIDELARQKEKEELEQLSKSFAVQDNTPVQGTNYTNDTSVANDTNYNNSVDCDDQPVTNSQSDHSTSRVDNNNANSSTSSRQANETKAAPIIIAPTISVIQSKTSSSEDKRKQVEELIGSIPTDKEQLFKRNIEWSLLDDTLMEKRIRPWITKKIAEYMGEKEADLIDFICGQLTSHTGGATLLKEVAVVLDDEAEKFVVHLWRLLIFELEAKKIGLRK